MSHGTQRHKGKQPLAAIGLAAGALFFVACPPREVAIQISAVGAQTLIGTCGTGLDALVGAQLQCDEISAQCENLTDECARPGCLELDSICASVGTMTLETTRCSEFYDLCVGAVDSCPIVSRELCDNLVAQCDAVAKALESVCLLPDLERPDFIGGRVAFAVRVALVTQVGGELRGASQCGRAESFCDGAATSDCVATVLNQAIAAAISEDGLGFEGLEEADQTLPLLLAFDDADGAGCAPEEMFGCAALGRLVPASETYDAVCGWCQEGIKPIIPTAPCQSACELAFCHDVAEQTAGD